MASSVRSAGARSRDDPTDLVETVPGGRRSGVDVSAGRRRLGVPRLLGRLQQQIDAGQTLTDGVVDLPRQPGPLGQGAGAVLLLGELGLGLDELVEQILAGS